MTIRQQLFQKIKTAPPGSSWLAQLVWYLIDLDLPALEEFDIEIADAIAHAPDAPWEANGHTLSWHLGQLEEAGDPTATAVCNIIAAFMGPDHCINAYEHGS